MLSEMIYEPPMLLEEVVLTSPSPPVESLAPGLAQIVHKLHRRYQNCPGIFPIDDDDVGEIAT